MPERKKWYRSRMLWANVIGITVIVVSALVSPDNAEVIVAAEGSILGVINLILRILTNQGLEP